MENASKGMHSNKNSRSISSEASAGLSASTFCLPPPPPRRYSGKKETTIGYYAAIILNNRNVAKHLWREPQIIKFENAFHIWINLWLHLQMHTFCNVACQVTLPCASYRLQLTIAILLCCYSFRAVISQNWSAPDSIRYFINGEQNYLFKYI